MASSKYDEDVYENPFFTKIISEHQDHLERAASSKGIVRDLVGRKKKKTFTDDSCISNFNMKE